MVLIHDTEMRRTEPEAAVSSSDNCKIVADTPDGFSEVVRTSTGVRISAQMDEQILEGIAIGSNGSKSDPFDAMPAKDEVTCDESVTLCDGVNKEMVESDRFRAASLEIRVKEEPDLQFENRVSDQEEEMIVDSIAKSVVEVVSRASYNECANVKVKEEPGLATRLEEEPPLKQYVSVFPDVLATKDEVDLFSSDTSTFV